MGGRSGTSIDLLWMAHFLLDHCHVRIFTVFLYTENSVEYTWYRGDCCNIVEDYTRRDGIFCSWRVRTTGTYLVWYHTMDLRLVTTQGQ